MGAGAGLLMGASGISAPISITFLNALRLDRVAFVATISVFFATTSLPQIGLLAYYGVLTPPVAALSLAALIPILGMMPVGAYLARFLSKEAFDRIILGILTVLALRIVVGLLIAGQ
jgi:hypothetical protein